MQRKENFKSNFVRNEICKSELRQNEKLITLLQLILTIQAGASPFWNIFFYLASF